MPGSPKAKPSSRMPSPRGKKAEAMKKAEAGKAEAAKAKAVNVSSATAGMPNKNERTEQPPPKKKRKQSRKKKTNLKRSYISNIGTSMGGEIILKGIECYDNVYLAYLESTGQRSGEGYYVKPIDVAWKQTVCDAENASLKELYPNSNQFAGSIVDRFNVDYWVNRREERDSIRIKTVSKDKSFPWKTFLWIRPDEEDDQVKGTWTLNMWLEHLKNEIERFMIWTRSNADVYTEFKYPVTLRIKSIQQIHNLADEVDDITTVEVMRVLYNEITLKEAEKDMELKNEFFSETLDLKAYEYRLSSAWNQLEQNDG